MKKTALLSILAAALVALMGCEDPTPPATNATQADTAVGTDKDSTIGSQTDVTTPKDDATSGQTDTATVDPGPDALMCPPQNRTEATKELKLQSGSVCVEDGTHEAEWALDFDNLQFKFDGNCKAEMGDWKEACEFTSTFRDVGFTPTEGVEGQQWNVPSKFEGMFVIGFGHYYGHAFVTSCNPNKLTFESPVIDGGLIAGEVERIGVDIYTTIRLIEVPSNQEVFSRKYKNK